MKKDRIIRISILILAMGSWMDARADFSTRLQPRATGSGIQKLIWRTLDLPILVEGTGADAKIFAVIEGKIAQGGASLILGKNKIALRPDGRFKLKIPMPQSEFQFVLTSVDLYGKAETETLKITIKEWAELQATLKEPPPKRWGISLGTGLTLMNYSQPSLSLNETALTVKVAGVYVLLPGKLDVGLSGFMNAWVPTTSDSGGNRIRFIGVNFRVGWIVPWVTKPWRLGIMGGGYFSTTTTSPIEFGYQNVMGPQLFPTLSYTFKNRMSLGTYFKFSPVTDGLSVMSLANREIASGLRFALPLSRKLSLGFSFDFADLGLTFDSGVVAARTYSFSTDLAF